MKTSIWMPLYIGDYLADTIGLSREEHGAYLLSLMAYWRKGNALSVVEAKQIMGESFDRIRQFFQLDGDMLYHKRIEAELLLAGNRKLRAKENGSKGGRPKNKPKNNLQVSYGLAKPNPNETSSPSPSPSPSPSQSQSQSQSQSKRKKKELTSIPEDFGISENIRVWANTNGHENLELHLQYFRDAALAKNYQYADWDAAFRNAIAKNWAQVGSGLARQGGVEPPRKMSEMEKKVRLLNAFAKGEPINGGNTSVDARRSGPGHVEGCSIGITWDTAD